MRLQEKRGMKSEEISEEISTNLTNKQKDDEDHPKKLNQTKFYLVVLAQSFPKKKLSPQKI